MRLTLATAAGLLLFGACAPKIMFNHDIRKNLQSRNVPPDKLQFYIDREVELRREITTDNTRLSAGTVKLEKGKRIEIIAIPQFTPGICLNQTDSSLQIAFEGNNERYLIFSETVNSNGVLIYSLQTQEDTNGQIRVKYGSEMYYLNKTDAQASVLIKRKLNRKEKTRTRTVKGRKLN